jgi:hypothetical protein
VKLSAQRHPGFELRAVPVSVWVYQKVERATAGAKRVSRLRPSRNLKNRIAGNLIPRDTYHLPMLRFAMQPDILCDLHLKPLRVLSTASGVDTFRKEQWSDTFRACAEPGCHTHFNRNKGYVDIRDSRIIDHKHNWCRNHKEPKAIVAVRSGQPVWQCLHDNCLRRTTLGGATISVGDMVSVSHGHHGRWKVWSIGEDEFATLQMFLNAEGVDSLIDQWIRVPVDDLYPNTLKAATG